MDCSKSPLMHKHHIVPRYMGGTDKETNLVEVTVTQHAMYHFCNYQLWGNVEDKFAWKGLTGQIGKEEIILELLLKNQPRAIELARTPEAIEKKKKTFKEIEHQKGEKNSQYGKMWITNGTKEGTYRINKDDPIPEGYWKGRISRNVESIPYYVIISPDGETTRTKYLIDYCKLKNLRDTHMYQVANGKKSHHKGYTVYKEEIKT